MRLCENQTNRDQKILVAHVLQRDFDFPVHAVIRRSERKRKPKPTDGLTPFGGVGGVAGDCGYGDGQSDEQESCLHRFQDSWFKRSWRALNDSASAYQDTDHRHRLELDQRFMKKRPFIRFPKPKPQPKIADRSWHNGGDIEIMMYTHSLHKAAKTLIGGLDLEPNPKTAWDACPVILLYREAVELQLKSVVEEGGSFMHEPTDPLSLAKTDSLRWLAQIVCQIIKAVRWESEFKCEGVESLADFSALVRELEELDPVAVAVRPGKRRADGWVPPQLESVSVVPFAKRLDALLDLLAATADGLATEWDLQQEAMSGEGVDKPMIH